MQKNNGKPFDLNLRKGGSDWTLLGATMTGWERLDNVRKLLTDVIQSNIPGDYIETGVWRGGSSVFARAVITAHGEQEKRVSYVAIHFPVSLQETGDFTKKTGAGTTPRTWKFHMRLWQIIL